jgi:hypothetical protein
LYHVHSSAPGSEIGASRSGLTQPIEPTAKPPLIGIPD